MRYGFRIVGSPKGGQRRLIDAAAAFAAHAECDTRAKCDCEAYLSAFDFGEDFRQHLERTGSTRGFDGVCGGRWLWWDIDREDDLEAARADAGQLALHLCERFAISEFDILLFFSGSKGFHVGLPTELWGPEPSADFNRVARQFCETVATSVGIEVDAGVYDKVRAFRAPNSRHPKTGLHKRALSLRDVLDLDAGAICELAEKPEPFDEPSPTPGSGDWNMAALWQESASELEREAQAVAQRKASESATLNRVTLDFIRDGATNGDRHRLLFSAAANLAEFGCPAVMAHALLTEAGLDSGLPPAEVRRQIDCGLEHTGGVR